MNRKGFTLVELLAVIIILAIVVGITIPAVLTTTNNAKKKAFGVAVSTIQSYIQSQYDMKNLDEDFRSDTFIEEIAAANCTEDETNECKDDINDDEDTNALTITGYDKNIDSIVWSIDSGKVKIECATASENGDYIQSDEYSSCGGIIINPVNPINPGENAGINPPIVNPGLNS